jgi:hypothetical protein
LGLCRQGSKAPTVTLGVGYTRDGRFIRFKGKRIDLEGAGNIAGFSTILGRKVSLCSAVDAPTFKVLSGEYTADKNKVYYKWISGPDFWVVEIPDADPVTFEVLGFNLAKDKNHVWREDEKLPGADAKTAKSIAKGRVWADANHVWTDRRIVEGADPKTLVPYGDGHHYRDDKQVYWIFDTFKVVSRARIPRRSNPERPQASGPPWRSRHFSQMARKS